MSAATIAIASGKQHARSSRPSANLRTRLRASFYKFLEQLPEHYQDIDPEVLKRVPAPISLGCGQAFYVTLRLTPY